MGENKCKDMVRPIWRSRSKEIDALLRGESDTELDEYFLSVCYEPAGSENDLLEGYAEFLISWGGPSEELRLYYDLNATKPYKAIYWYKDWFDGVSLDVTKHRTPAALFERYEEYLRQLKRTATASGRTECL